MVGQRMNDVKICKLKNGRSHWKRSLYGLRDHANPCNKLFPAQGVSI